MLYGIDRYGTIVLIDDEILEKITFDDNAWQGNEDFHGNELKIEFVVLPGKEDEENSIYQTFDYC
ncbi:MAG: hypothetical protein IKG14_00740 [Clostridia bacterium]|nr:hypothetical protein [Clostridia bacterium]